MRQAHLKQAEKRTGLLALRPGASDKLIRIIEQALHPDPSNRFGSAESMAVALEGLKSHSGQASVRKGAPYWIAAAACGLAAVLPFLLPSGWRPGNSGNSGAKGKVPALAAPSPGASARRLEMPDLMMAGKPSTIVSRI